MSTNLLALGNMTGALLPNGHIQIGDIEAPAHQVRDWLAHIWELTGQVPEEVEGRIACRLHLDRDFEGAGMVQCWATRRGKRPKPGETPGEPRPKQPLVPTARHPRWRSVRGAAHRHPDRGALA